MRPMTKVSAGERKLVEDLILEVEFAKMAEMEKMELARVTSEMVPWSGMVRIGLDPVAVFTVQLGKLDRERADSLVYRLTKVFEEELQAFVLEQSRGE